MSLIGLHIISCYACSYFIDCVVFRLVWPKARIFLCLFHVKKAWLEIPVKKIIQIEEHAIVLKLFGEIMYGKVQGLMVIHLIEHWSNLTTSLPSSSHIFHEVYEQYEQCVKG